MYQLVNFSFSNYKGTDAKNADPEVNQLRWLSTDELNAGFCTAGTPINFSDEVWDNLKNAIPTEWADTLLKGNQSFYDDEFFASVLGSQIGDVYRYKNGTLHYYQWDDHDEDAGNELHDNIKPTIYRGVSGQTNQEGDYPTLNQLKRIKVAKNDGTLTVVSWYLSDYTKDRLINGGIVHDMFTHDLGGDMKSISKQWRAKQFSTRHRHIQEFCSIVFNDPDYDLTKVYGASRIFPGAPPSCRGSELSPVRPATGPSRPPLGGPKRAPPKHSPISHGGCCYFWDPPFSILTDFANPLANSFLAMSATFKVD